MTKRDEIPKFGPLCGVSVVNSGARVAGPFAAQMFADFGADVIWIEQPSLPDTNRYGDHRLYASLDRRNRRSLVLNIKNEDGRKVFLRLLRQTDVFIESSRGGTFDGFGLSDEVLWKANPALVIVHISGFGQTGIPDYVRRPSWDGIGQAFGGYVFLNGNPEPESPVATVPYTCDYFTGYSAAMMGLAALLKARETGRGECVDVAQYEAMVRCQFYYPLKHFATGEQAMRTGNENTIAACFKVYRCKDGKYIFMALVGFGVLKSGLPLFGFEFGSKDFPATEARVYQGSPAAEKLEQRVQEFFDSRTLEEAERDLVKAGIPCSPVMNYEMMENHHHYQAREVFVEWDNPIGMTVKGPAPLPKLKNNPGQIWRGYPTFGMDNDDILIELGYSLEEIAKLYENETIAKDDSI